MLDVRTTSGMRGNLVKGKRSSGDYSDREKEATKEWWHPLYCIAAASCRAT